MGHLINPIQFRLGHSAFSDRNWPALNKEQYMFCYGIQKDFTDYFRSIFLFKKKLVLKRKHRKRKFFTKNKHPRLLFSNCNVNFWGFNLNRVLVDVNIFDLRFESKWDSLFDNKRFQNFIFNFGQVFRTAKILRKPTFFINIKKETIKKFFLILNNQYHKINGTLLSQTTRWVKSYLSKIYQKFFSFFTDSSYLVNKRKTVRKAKRYIKKRSAKAHIFITSKYKKRQKRKFLKNWSKIFLLLNPINAQLPTKIYQIKNKKKISKLKKILLIKKKYVFNFTDLFDIYFKVIAHKFAKKVRRRDLNRFYTLVENAKTIDYLKSIKKDFKFSLTRLSLNRSILSLIPLEDKIRLYKSQAHYYLKNIVLKKQNVPVEKYIRILPALDLDRKLRSKFDIFKKQLNIIENRVNMQNLTKKPYTRASFAFGLNKFISNVKLFFSYINTFRITTETVLQSFKQPQLLFPYIILPAGGKKKWFEDFFKKIILEFTLYKNRKGLVSKPLIRFMNYFFFKKAYIYGRRLYREKIKTIQVTKRKLKKKIRGKVRKIIRRTTKYVSKKITRNINSYPNKRYVKLKHYKLRSVNLKNILKNWIMYEGNFWFERLLAQVIRAVKTRQEKQYQKDKKVLVKKIIKLRKSTKRIYKIKFYNKFIKKLKPNFLTNRNLKLTTIFSQRNHLQNKLFLYNNLNNFNFEYTHKELRHSLDYSNPREKFLKGSSLPAPKVYYNDKKNKIVATPVFEADRPYKTFESPSLISNLDPFINENRSRVTYHYTLDPFFQKYMKLKKLKSLLINIAVDIGNKRIITAKFLSHWLKSLFKKGKKLSYVLRTLDRFIRPSNNYIGAVSVLFVGRFTRSAYTTNKYYKFGRLNNGEILKQMDYDSIEFTTKFGMCGIKVKMQYKVNVFANRDLANYLKTSFSGSEAMTYKFDQNLHLPMSMKYGSKRLFRLQSNLKYKNNIPFYQFK